MQAGTAAVVAVVATIVVILLLIGFIGEWEPLMALWHGCLSVLLGLVLVGGTTAGVVVVYFSVKENNVEYAVLGAILTCICGLPFLGFMWVVVTSLIKGR